MTRDEIDEMLASRDAIHAALVKEMKKRPKCDGLGWIENERDAVADRANRWALTHGRPTITVHDVERVERRAMGHIDYGTKLALYVAELIYGVGV